MTSSGGGVSSGGVRGLSPAQMAMQKILKSKERMLGNMRAAVQKRSHSAHAQHAANHLCAHLQRNYRSHPRKSLKSRSKKSARSEKAEEKEEKGIGKSAIDPIDSIKELLKRNQKRPKYFGDPNKSFNNKISDENMGPLLDRVEELLIRMKKAQGKEKSLWSKEFAPDTLNELIIDYLKESNPTTDFDRTDINDVHKFLLFAISDQEENSNYSLSELKDLIIEAQIKNDEKFAQKLGKISEKLETKIETGELEGISEVEQETYFGLQDKCEPSNRTQFFSDVMEIFDSCESIEEVKLLYKHMIQLCGYEVRGPIEFNEEEGTASTQIQAADQEYASVEEFDKAKRDTEQVIEDTNIEEEQEPLETNDEEL